MSQISNSFIMNQVFCSSFSRGSSITSQNCR